MVSVMSMELRRQFVREQHEKKKSRTEILKMSKSIKLNAMFVKRTLDWHEKTSSTKDCPRIGCPRSQRTKKVIKAAREIFKRNPQSSMRQMATEEHQTTSMTIHRLCRNGLSMYPYRL